ncbi:MAG: T9SS type A sorting domain-containing protein, partial [Bacteroidales bacterium]|nr:T9SS type A sorting domain-containing protein [Bacteroidales bacterium]
DMIFNGTADFAPETGTVNFVGSGDQTITKSNEIEFNNVVFNQGTAGHTITADNGMTINGAATFTKGIVDGDVTFADGASATANTYESYVDGTVTKSGSASGFTFPTGNNGVLGKVTATSDVSGVSVRYHNDPDGFGLDVYPRWWNINDMCSGNTPQFDHVSNFEYWDIATTASLSATLTVSSADGSAHFNANTQTHDGADVYGAFWNGSCWENIGGADHSVSDNPYGTITVGVTIPQTRATGNKIVSLGSQNHSTVLPIELTALTATCDGRKALVEWTTASERNNDYFSLERSDDAINFTEIARIAGAGNSIVPLDYSYTDYGVHGGDNYYRLVQVDYDGTRTASEIVVANCIEASGEPEVLAYPNPFSGDLTVELENFGDRPARIDVYDMLGRLVYTEEVGAPQNNYQTVLHFGNLPDATYTVRVGTADFVINRKVVKQQ